MGERADEPPRVFTKIHAVYTVTGAGLSLDRVEEAVRLSADKYCSASVMLGKSVKITREVTVVDTVGDTGTA